MSLELVREFVHKWPLHLLTTALFAAVLIIAPQQAGLFVYKGSLIFGGAIGAYWVNRIMFNRHPGSPHKVDGEKTMPIGSLFTGRDVHADWQLCVMVCAAMLACSLAA